MAQAKTPIVITGLKVADILAAVTGKQVAPADAAAELTRRIDQRAAAGKHPMPFVIEARDKLVASLQEAGAAIVRRRRRATTVAESA